VSFSKGWARRDVNREEEEGGWGKKRERVEKGIPLTSWGLVGFCSGMKSRNESMKL
jgi:hypothetical protein